MTNYKPIKTKEIKTIFQCPLCTKKSESEDQIESHLLEHELKDLIKEIKLIGKECYFKNIDQANRFIKLYHMKWNEPYGDEYNISIKYDGPGKYYMQEPVLIAQRLDENVYNIKFKKALFQ